MSSMSAMSTLNTARSKILANVRKSSLKPVPLPVMPKTFSAINREQLLENAKKCGATISACRENDCAQELQARIGDAQKYFSTFSPIPSTCTVTPQTTAPDLQDLQIAILMAEFIVEENAALWLPESALVNRLMVCIPETMIVLVSSHQIVKNMHEAYARINRQDKIHTDDSDAIKQPESGLAANRYGVFLSGPSKTADIEQALVIGAHGAKGLHILLVDES